MKRRLISAFAGTATMVAGAPEKGLPFEGEDGPGQGNHVVLISGDEEYRSEESRPILAEILSHHYGFDTTVPTGAEVDYAGTFSPCFIGFWHRKGGDILEERALPPADFGLGKSPVAPEPKGEPEWGFCPIKK